jgi:hypothetical protein
LWCPTEILKKSDEATLAVAVRSNVFCGFDDALLQVARDPSDSAFFLARRQRLAALDNRHDAEVGWQRVVLKWHATYSLPKDRTL